MNSRCSVRKKRSNTNGIIGFEGRLLAAPRYCVVEVAALVVASVEEAVDVSGGEVGGVELASLIGVEVATLPTVLAPWVALAKTIACATTPSATVS